METTKLEAKKSPIQNTGSDLFTSEAFKAALTKGLLKVFKREFAIVEQGMQFFREESQKRESETIQAYRQIGGSVPQNRDADEIPYVTTSDGFSYTRQTFNYRRGLAIERTLMEVDDVGVIRNRQADLARNAAITREQACADVFNRMLGTAGAPVLADDGMYLIDSDRPNADPNGGLWSNLESTAVISPDSIFQAQLNARATTGDDGELFPLKIQYIVCRPQDSKKLWEIANSDYRPTDAMNVNNYFKEMADAKFDVIVYDHLTAANIIYGLCDPKSDMNELQYVWRVKPSFLTWQDGTNPDIMRQRVRMAFGLALGSPRKAWRGGAVG
jgi:phage major head subunit gpT-like protein